MDHIESLFERYFDELSEAEKLTLWIESENGGYWYYNNDKEDNFKYEKAPVFFGDCVKVLMSGLNEIAINFESKNITNYIEYNCQGVDEEVEDNDE